jgi:FkbM family methyltransferase
MLISLDVLVNKYKINFNGILHVGAHECEEIHSYNKYLPNNKIVWVEAIPDKVNICKNKFPDINIENAIISDKIEDVTFNVSNNFESSSFLQLQLHSVYHPHIHYTNSFQGTTTTLDTIIQKYDIDFNFVNLDIQGVELKALKGMESYLHNIDYIYTEVNSDYVYKDCALIGEIDEYLKKFGLIRVETFFTDCKWGDALYVRISKL